MTGYSFNQLKHWTPDLLKSTYDGLVICWERKQYLPEWKWRWLKALAKKSTAEISAVGDLRPIILVEALRKIWSKCVLRKLQAVWRKHDILNVSQHGYSAQRGTYTAMLQHLNLLEDAIEYGLPLHSETWDMHKAFDSVSKNLMRMAWHRAGVPLDIAQWLAEIDINGVTVIKFNHALNTWVKRGYYGVCQPGAQLQVQ